MKDPLANDENYEHKFALGDIIIQTGWHLCLFHDGLHKIEAALAPGKGLPGLRLPNV